jgi:hypothetical protein
MPSSAAGALAADAGSATAHGLVGGAFAAPPPHRRDTISDPLAARTDTARNTDRGSAIQVRSAPAREVYKSFGCSCSF